MTKKAYFKFGAIFVLVMMFLPSIVFEILKREDLKQRNTEKYIREELDKTNQKLPSMISEETRLNKVTMPIYLMFERYHTWINLHSSEAKFSHTDKQNFINEVTDEVCSDTSYRKLFKNRAKVTFIYASNDDKEVLRFTVAEGNCRQSN